MYLYCLICWLVMIVDSFCIRTFYSYIKARRWLKAATVYIWLTSILLGITSFVSILIMEVQK